MKHEETKTKRSEAARPFVFNQPTTKILTSFSSNLITFYRLHKMQGIAQSEVEVIKCALDYMKKRKWIILQRRERS